MFRKADYVLMSRLKCCQLVTTASKIISLEKKVRYGLVYKVENVSTVDFLGEGNKKER